MRASCSPQSELRPGLMGLAPSYDLATHCPDHCTTCVAQGIKGHADLASSSPSSSYSEAVLCDTYNTERGLRMLTHLRERFTVHADDNRAPPDPDVLVRKFSFQKTIIRLSSPGKVPRLTSN